MSAGSGWSHSLLDRNETPKRTESDENDSDRLLASLPRARQRPVSLRRSGLLQPLLNSSPRPPTHWEPSGSRPGPHFVDLQSRQVAQRRLPPAGRGRLWHGCAVLSDREYGRPEGSDLRSYWGALNECFSESAIQFAAPRDRGGMKRKTTYVPPFFTERTLAAYLAVSDRTIRNWIRRGELSSYKLGASRRIDPADVDAFLETRREEAA